MEVQIVFRHFQPILLDGIGQVQIVRKLFALKTAATQPATYLPFPHILADNGNQAKSSM